jgi:hypothetical protein
LDLHSWTDFFYAPRFTPLGRPATAADVVAGRAVFRLDGQGQAVAMRLPATAQLLRDHDVTNAPRVLIVQAERDSEGVVHYGIVEAHRKT